MNTAARRWWRYAVEYLPKGQSLPDDAWRPRHRALCWLLRAHVVGIFAFSILRGFGVAHSLADTVPVAVLAGLAGLPNRPLCRDRVGHALARNGRRPGASAVLFVDLDKFKDVNDSLGHPAGDQLLTSVADRLRAVVRPGDTVARLGGDEFAVLAEDVVSEADAAGLASRVLDALAAPFALRSKEMAVGASIGVALSSPGDTVDELLRNADVAMYNAKNAGRGCFRVFEDDM